MSQKLHPRLAKARALSTAALDDEIAASDLTQFQLGELVGIDDRAVRRLLDPERKRADRLDLLVALRRLTPAAARASREELGHAPGIALVVDGAASRLTNTNTLTGAPAPTSPVSPDVETAAAAAELAPRGRRAA